MKDFVIISALVAYCAAAQMYKAPSAQDERSISGSIISAIENIRDQMPCGFPELGVPPVAPLKIPRKDINIDRSDIKATGSITQLTLNGLDNFDIEELKVNILSSKVTYRFVFKNINVDSLYDLKAELQKAGFTVKLQGKGSAKYALKDIIVWGTIKYKLGVASGKMQVKSMEIRIRIGSAESEIKGIMGEGKFNDKMNDILAEAVPQLVNENEDLITENIEKIALPLANKILESTSLSDLIGGGSNGNSKPQCNPERIQ